MSNVLVVGAGVAGIETAGQLARAGFKITLVEKDHNTGGHIQNWNHLFPDLKDSGEVIKYLENQIKHPKIEIKKGLRIDKVRKKHDKFFSTASDGTEIESDSVVIATGFDLFRSERKEEYGYGIYDNVITSAELEVMFRKNEIIIHNGKIPSKIGFVHCVGSRDEKVGNQYCSKLCCVTAVKQAMEVKKYLPESRVFCFYMDIRMGGAHYEELYRESQEKFGVTYIRGKVSEVSENINGCLVIKAEDTLAGRPLKMELDMLVLMPGMEMSETGTRLAEASGLRRNENRFFSVEDPHFASNKSEIDGLFYAGTCTAPLNITESITHARSAAADVIDFLSKMK